MQALSEACWPAQPFSGLPLVWVMFPFKTTVLGFSSGSHLSFFNPNPHEISRGDKGRVQLRNRSVGPRFHHVQRGMTTQTTQQDSSASDDPKTYVPGH